MIDDEADALQPSFVTATTHESQMQLSFPPQASQKAPGTQSCTYRLGRAMRTNPRDEGNDLMLQLADLVMVGQVGRAQPAALLLQLIQLVLHVEEGTDLLQGEVLELQ
ncbi:MAG: hypothetical protein FRX49_00618 [Trebouxia sp. A1-2]|nr:MAG: hypothetical protein FRX49_00618 [Trebouxia sp. A1-2]